jgi:hypothetical protein
VLRTVTGDDVGAFIDEVFWTPHASPGSVWGLVATYPLLILAVYRRSGPLLATVVCSVVLNLRIASPPDDDAAWATRVVFGERRWLDRGLSSQPDALGLVGVGAAVQLYTLRAAATRRPGRTVAGTAVSMLLMLAFFDRMARLYDDHGTADSGQQPAAE